MENEENGTPKYVVLEKSLVGNTLYEAGAIVEYDGLPAENLQPTCDVGRARYQEYLRSNAERVARMKDQFGESAVGDPDAFAKAFARELAAQKAEADAKFEALQAQNTQALTLIAQLVEKLGGAATPAAVEAPAPATDAAAAAAAAAPKPAGKAKADKPAADSDGLV
jgi:hypothetical protein